VIEKKFRVLVIEYDKEKEEDIKRLVKDLEKKVIKQQGETHNIYEGSDERTISALGKILKLANEPK
jgi:hypothetical protein